MNSFSTGIVAGLAALIGAGLFAMIFTGLRMLLRKNKN